VNKISFAVLGLALVSLVAGVALRARDPFDTDNLIAHPGASAEWQGAAARALERVTRGTRYTGKWQINKSPAKGKLTLVLIDSDQLDATKLAPGLDRNCTYTGRNELIICDVALVRKFIAERDLDKTTQSTYDAMGRVLSTKVVPLARHYVVADYQMMLEWILGHELGHILNGDGRAHFSSSRFEDNVKNTSLDQRRELAADAFLARQFDGDSDSDFYFFLVDILNREVDRKACPGRSPVLGCPNTQVGMLIFSPSDYLRYSTSATHPEFVIRMDRLLILADRRHSLGVIGPLARELGDKLLAEGAPRPGPKSQRL